MPLSWVCESRDFADLSGGKVVELQQCATRCCGRKVDALFRDAPVAPETGLMMVGHQFLFAARRWHAPQTGQHAALAVVEIFAIERFKAFKATLLRDLYGLSVSGRHLPNLHAAAAIR